MVIDMRSMISDQTLEAFKDMTMKAEGGNLEIPFSAAVGSWLPDATMHMDIIDKGQSFATIDITITDRRVEAKEDVTTPVGVFSCVKISYNSETKMKTMGIGVPMNLHSVTWYSKKVGMVKSDSFSRDMKPMGSRILTEVSQ